MRVAVAVHEKRVAGPEMWVPVPRCGSRDAGRGREMWIGSRKAGNL